MKLIGCQFNAIEARRVASASTIDNSAAADNPASTTPANHDTSEYDVTKFASELVSKE